MESQGLIFLRNGFPLAGECFSYYGRMFRYSDWSVAMGPVAVYQSIRAYFDFAAKHVKD